MVHSHFNFLNSPPYEFSSITHLSSIKYASSEIIQPKLESLPICNIQLPYDMTSLEAAAFSEKSDNRTKSDPKKYYTIHNAKSYH